MQKLNPKTTDDRTKKEEAHQAKKAKKKYSIKLTQKWQDVKP